MMSSLENLDFREFFLKDLFDLALSKGDNQAKLLDEGNIPLISSGTTNNGVCKFIQNGDGKSQKFHADVITVDMFGKVFYQPFKFYAVSHGRINILIPKQNIDPLSLMFLVSVIQKSLDGIFSYNRMCSQARLEKIKILLPSKQGVPDWEFMQEYMKNIEKKLTKKAIKYYEAKLSENGGGCRDSLENLEWIEFRINDLFIVSGTVTTHPNKLIANGKIPRITCQATNNGLENTYQNRFTECGGVITIDSATIGYVSYQENNFIATDHVEKLALKSNKKINRYAGLFLVNAITNATKGKYGYGYKFSQDRIKKQSILLPSKQGVPDWEFMQEYMKQKEHIFLQKMLKFYKAKG